MTASNFITNQLQVLSNKYSNTCFMYGYNTKIRTHIVDIRPKSHFDKNDELANDWINVSLDFMTTFPQEEIAFITEDSSLVLDEYSFVLNHASSNESEIMVELFKPLLETSYKDELLKSLILRWSLKNINSQFTVRTTLQNITHNRFDSIKNEDNQECIEDFWSQAA